MRVTLTPDEIRLACQHSAERYSNVIIRGVPNNARLKSTYITAEDSHTVACLAEMSVAKALNLYWSGVGGVNYPDVGGRLEVRATIRLDGKLIITTKEKPEQVVVLVTCEPPHFNVIGFITARKAMQDNWLYETDKGHCWMVPQSALERFNEDKVKQVPPMDQDAWLFNL